ncbi:MAG: hypothetical protein AAFU64_20845, partial [Bacteroidota bacterium]
NRLMQILIQEENFAGKILDQIHIQIDKERITVQELIRKKVENEVAHYEQRRDAQRQDYFQATESQLNSKKSQQVFPKTDPEKEVYKAWQAFQNNQFFLFVGDEQMETLEQEILLGADTTLRFMQLTPLVGG